METRARARRIEPAVYGVLISWRIVKRKITGGQDGARSPADPSARNDERRSSRTAPFLARETRGGLLPKGSAAARH